MSFHSTTIFTSAHLLPLSLAHLPNKTNLNLLSSITKVLLTHTLASFWGKQSCFTYMDPLTYEDRIDSVQHSQYHGCWCPGSVRRQDISTHDIHNVECSKLLSYLRKHLNCVMSTWRNDTKSKYMFLVPLKNLACEGFINTYFICSIFLLGSPTSCHLPPYILSLTMDLLFDCTLPLLFNAELNSVYWSVTDLSLTRRPNKLHKIHSHQVI